MDIDRITPHCVVGQCSVETLGNIFLPSSKQASCNYGIGTDGRVLLCVDEGNRSWCSSSNANDQRAVTIECASDNTDPYAFNDAVYNKLIDLCVDICQRNGKSKLLWLGDKDTTLNYSPASDEMVLSAHRWFASKSCPGDWMYNRMSELASSVTSRLGDSTSTGSTSSGSSSTGNETLYRVQVGAYAQKSNADNMAAKLEAEGYDTYIVQSDGLYKVQVGAYAVKSNADAMAAKLEAAGYDTYISTESGTSVSATSTKSIDELATEVIRGDWGNGSERRQRLEAAGYDYDAVQARVNEMLS